MVSLARCILFHERRKFIAAALAVATALTIVLVQVGMALGFAEKATFILDHSRADLWITSPTVQTFDRPGRLHKKHALAPMIHPDVTGVETIVSTHLAITQDGAFKIARIFGFEMDKGIGFPLIFGEENRARLRENDTILLERTAVGMWGAETGGFLNTDTVSVRIVGLVDDFSVGETPAIITSTHTAAKLTNAGNEQVHYIAIRLREGADKAMVKADLQPGGYEREYRVWENHELKEMTRNYWLSHSKLGTSFWVVSVISCLVGFIIIQQIIRILILDNIREYATLRALGVSFRSIAKVVLEKCLWIALAGCGLSLFVTLIARPLADHFGFYVIFPIELLIGAFIAAFLLCMAAGLLSFRVLYRSEPADLLRG